jgi:hypothetical protein
MRAVVFICVCVCVAVVIACTPFEGAPGDERDATTRGADGAIDDGALTDAAGDGSTASDAGADSHAGYSCVERAGLAFASRPACEAAAPSVSGCLADAGQPTGGEACTTSLAWCSCVESSVDTTVTLRVHDCSCTP